MGVLGALTARAEGTVLRLSLIFALLDCKNTISKEHLTAALAVWDYSVQSVKHIFGTVPSNPVAAKILDYLKDGSEKTQTEIHASFNRNLSATELKSALSELEELNRISRRKEEGKKTIYWKLVMVANS